VGRLGVVVGTGGDGRRVRTGGGAATIAGGAGRSGSGSAVCREGAET
jgi:hypothetical protein